MDLKFGRKDSSKVKEDYLEWFENCAGGLRWIEHFGDPKSS